MGKKQMVISNVSGEKRALVKGKGWMALPKINPNDQVYYIKDVVGEWDNFKTRSTQEEQHKLLADGYIKDLY